MFHLPLHPEPLLVRCSHRQAVLPPWLCSSSFPFTGLPPPLDGACLIDSICPTVKTLHRCQAPQHPTPRNQQTPAKALRDWKYFQGHYSQGAGEASEPHDACWEL